MKAIEEVERKMGLFNADMVRTIFLEKEAPKRLVGRAERGAVHVGVKDTSCGGTIICWSQGDARDNRSVFAKCVISGRAAAAEVGEEARNWGAGGRSSCQREEVLLDVEEGGHQKVKELLCQKLDDWQAET